MNRTVTDKKGNVIQLCSYRFVEPDGHVAQCFAQAVCPICQQCSRIDKEKEHGHCTGHLGLNQHIPVPGSDAFIALRKAQGR